MVLPSAFAYFYTGASIVPAGEGDAGTVGLFYQVYIAVIFVWCCFKLAVGLGCRFREMVDADPAAGDAGVITVVNAIPFKTPLGSFRAGGPRVVTAANTTLLGT